MADSTPARPAHRLGLLSATALVVANIICTGIFTTTGFLAHDVPSGWAILFIWLLGGVLALCGALSYGELASAMPRSGGEYHYLSRLYHPALGFASGVVSLIAGFAAPIAASAMAFGQYASGVLPAIDSAWAAAILVTLLSVLHALDVQRGTQVQNFFTLVKVGLIVAFIGAGLVLARGSAPSVVPTTTDWMAVFSSGFAVGLVFVSFAYSGWNAAAYLSGEIREPQRNVPRALLIGTLIVAALYLGLNLVFITAAPLSALDNKAEVGAVAAEALLGGEGGRVVSTIIALALVSSVSSMVMAGPRITAAIGEDLTPFAALARRSGRGGPVLALVLQWALAQAFIWSATLRQVIEYIGFTLGLFTFLAVLGVFILRARPQLAEAAEGRIRTWGYPVVPALFLCLSAWMVTAMLLRKPEVALPGLGTVALGVALYFVVRRR